MTASRDFAVIMLAAAAFGAVLAWADHSRAQERHEGHAAHHDVYQHWRQPEAPWASCCNAKYGPEGQLLEGGDCYKTRAALWPTAIAGKTGLVWWAERDQGRGWIEIPDAAIIRERNPDPTGEAAHVCINETTGRVLCFREPVSGI
jgi:hypothetical protein